MSIEYWLLTSWLKVAKMPVRKKSEEQTIFDVKPFFNKTGTVCDRIVPITVNEKKIKDKIVNTFIANHPFRCLNIYLPVLLREHRSVRFRGDRRDLLPRLFCIRVC